MAYVLPGKRKSWRKQVGCDKKVDPWMLQHGRDTSYYRNDPLWKPKCLFSRTLTLLSRLSRNAPM